MSNRVFYQHPNLMRALGMHETVMEVMVNVLGGGDSKVNIVFKSIQLCCCPYRRVEEELKIPSIVRVVIAIT